MKYSDIPLPKTWPKRVKSAFVNAVSLAHASLTYSRAWCADSPLKRVQLAGELDQARQEIALLREEIRIKDVRMARIPPHHRPFYPPVERLAIHALRAARGWNLAQTARAFLIEPATAANWSKRLDEDGEQALVKLPAPACPEQNRRVNKYPDFVALVVKQLKVLCPIMGKKRIAHFLCQAALPISATSIGRFLKQKHQPTDPMQETNLIESSERKIIANYPNHVWHVDLTIVPTQAGFWTTWLPFSLPQVWPFCYWIAIVMDHFSRRIMGFAVFKHQPSSLEIRSFLARAFHLSGHVPKYIISDKGSQFWNHAFKQWCKRRKIKPRFGAVGRYGSIAVIERCIRSMKTEFSRQIVMPLRMSSMRRELGLYALWYNVIRPHQALAGKTPQEIYDGFPVSLPKYETRGKNGVKLKLSVSCFKGRKHLPIVSLQKAA